MNGINPFYNPFFVQRDERKAALEAVRLESSGLENLSEELQNDREIVMAAVLHYGEALQYAGPELQKERGLMRAAAFQQNREAMAPFYIFQKLIICLSNKIQKRILPEYVIRNIGQHYIDGFNIRHL